MLKLDRSLKEASARGKSRKKRGKTGDFNRVNLKSCCYFIVITDWIFLRFELKAEKKAPGWALLKKTVKKLSYNTCTEAVLVVPLGTSAPETITTTSPFSP